MRIIAKKALVDFCGTLPRTERGHAKGLMFTWYALVEAAEWANFSEVKLTFNTADWVGNGKVVFDVGGNKYRIVGLMGFRSKKVWLLFVGTHKQYDAIDVTKL